MVNLPKVQKKTYRPSSYNHLFTLNTLAMKKKKLAKKKYNKNQT